MSRVRKLPIPAHISPHSPSDKEEKGKMGFSIAYKTQNLHSLERRWGRQQASFVGDGDDGLV